MADDEEASIRVLELLVQVYCGNKRVITHEKFKLWEEGFGLCFEDAVPSKRHKADDGSGRMEVR